ncbi:hypothetical protein [Mesorhizobium sp. B2-8-5]|uniref:hypothetical protein n=1 Tax=Mesorhizobium sp. B2-8-5 TaxID=2589903 RepID=UPI0015E2D5DB|nr:hypothetical protein [Mesorhizobium sp. B2-8-5]UCI28238.1 hypothetical protein FJ430_11845 [Mesorhizobium sp. B2-8-5]
MSALDDVARAKLIEPPSLQPNDAALLAADFYRSLLVEKIVDVFSAAIAGA